MIHNDYLLEHMARERMRDTLRQAEMDGLLHKSGQVQRKGVSRRLGRLLSSLEHLLVSAGARLERRERSQEATLSVGEC